MLAFLRGLGLAGVSVLLGFLGPLWCLIMPRHPNHVFRIVRPLGWLTPLMGLKLEVRNKADDKVPAPAVVIGNHQNTLDMITISQAIPKRTVTLGKKSLFWIPFFGPLYWLSGNIMIDRSNRQRATETLKKAVERMHKKKLSVWIFPEGTRSRGRGLLPFKTGAFHTALQAGVPIVPIVASSLHGKFKWGRRHNGEVIVEVMEPIDTSGYDRSRVRELAEKCHQMMAERIAELDAEIAARRLAATA